MKRLFFMLIVLCFGGVFGSSAQDNRTTISITVPEFFEDTFRAAIDEFEVANPTIRVEIVTLDSLNAPIGGEADVATYLDNLEAYVQSADLLLLSNSQLTLEATRAGYILDLMPLINSDASLNLDDFYPAMLDAWRWEGGFWGLPIAGDALLLYYNPAAFDEAGLPYPNASWTLADFVNATRALAEVDSSGSVTRPGFLDFSGGQIGALIASFVGASLVDESAFQAQPTFDAPELALALDQWAELLRDGYITPQGEIDFAQVPFIFGGSFVGQAGSDASSQKRVALLPNGGAGVDTEGFAISAGTQSPEAAYALLKFLTTNPQVTNLFLGAPYPARHSLAGVQPQEGALQFALSPTSPETEAIVRAAFEQSVSGVEVYFASFLDDASQMMVNDELDAYNALDEYEARINERLQRSASRRDETNIVVEAITPLPQLATGEIEIRFGATGFASPFPNEALWEQAVADFAARDPEVGRVILDTTFPQSLQELAESYDCFYTPTNFIPTADLLLLRSIGPLVATDPQFDTADFVSGALSQVERDGQLWGVPIQIQPSALQYDSAVFADAGVSEPNPDWTIADFERTLRDFKLTSTDSIPFQPTGIGNTTLLTLIAIYGGMPIDYRTNPPTIDFTSSATVEAIRQVLDLAKNGYMSYNQLVARGGRVFTINVRSSEESIPLTTIVLNGLGFGAGGGVFVFGVGGDEIVTTGEDTKRLIPFPRGNQMNAITYDLGVGYISANSPHAEACYRLLMDLAGNSALFPAMPARYSQLNDPDLVATQGEATVAYYRTVAALLAEPNTIVIPTPDIGAGNLGAFLNMLWLNRAFDRYVLEDADLEMELQEAALYTTGYLACASVIPPFNPTADTAANYFAQFRDCAIQVDPSMADALPQ